MSDENKTTTDQILDLLLDALLERQAQRGDTEIVSSPSPEPEPEPEASLAPSKLDELPVFAELAPIAPDDIVATVTDEPEEFSEPEPEVWPEKLPSIELGKMLWQLSVAMFVLIIVVNVPFNRFGTNLARAMPDEQALVVRDGLVIKGSSDEIYVIEGNQKRWISSLDAFDYFGYRWEQVNEVDDDFLARFENGRPIHVLLKCPTSPHVYALEDGKKRWIKDIGTFEDEGYVWDDVKSYSCQELRALPNGVPIPADAVDPPQP